MSIRNLDRIFKPRRIALFGVCEKNDLGSRVMRNLLDGGFKGVVYPIHATCESVNGVATYRDAFALPRWPDLAVICNPAHQVPGIVRACGEAGIPGVLIISGGFREQGEEGKAIEHEVARLAREYDGMRILGPNSMGIIHPSLGFNASHSVVMPKAGRLAFISESRALCDSVMDWAVSEGIGFSSVVSIGNRVDIGFGDLIDYFGNDPETRAIILYVQSVRHARSFMSAARAFSLSKPIVVYRAGRFEETAAAMASHTGLMVGEDAVYEAAFQRCGVVRVGELDDIFDVAEVLASQRQPKGARLAIISNAGGPGIIATDALLSRGGELARLDPETVSRLDGVLPPVGSHRNPVDLLDAATPERYAEAMAIVLEDKNVDAVLVIFAIQTGSDPVATAERVIEAAKKSRKPMLAAWMGGERVRRGIQILNEGGLPTHQTPEQAARAFMHLVSYSRNLESLYETPRHFPVRFDLNRRKLRERLGPLLRGRGDLVPENQAKSFLKAYEIPVCETCVVSDEDAAVKLADKVGYPVVLKVVSPEVLHKVDVGGVALNLKQEAEVRQAYNAIIDNTLNCCNAHIKGISVQKMITDEQGLELILGAKKDPTFGVVIMVGMGGIATGVLKDRALGFPPLNERLVRSMLESLRFWPMLKGYRGRPPLNLDKLIEVIIRFSLLIADYPQIREFDINPLLVTADDVVALDAVMVLDEREAAETKDLYPHLSIHPYPEDYVRHIRDADGVMFILRSMRADDEPLWHGLIAASSPESIRFRFRSLFRQSTHKMAIEHCVLDYSRQISIVAETEGNGNRELAGVAQLVADSSHESAEFAVLVSDPWQGKKIGGMLLDYCMELAAQWGIDRVVAETDPDNTRMLDAFQKRGFSAEVNREDDVVLLERALEISARKRYADGARSAVT